MLGLTAFQQIYSFYFIDIYYLKPPNAFKFTQILNIYNFKNFS